MNTIYMNLESFVQKGLISKANFLHQFARYDGDTTPHPHFVCTRCRKIIDLHSLTIPRIPIPGEARIARVFEQQTQLNGICEECE